MKRILLQLISAVSLLALLASPLVATVQCQEKQKTRPQNPDKSLRAIFDSVLPQIKTKSHVPILLPSELPPPIAKARHVVVEKAAADEYAISLYYELGVGDSGFAAFFAAQGKTNFSPRELGNVESVNLTHGLHGFFRAVSCSGSCAPANLWWEQNGVLYQIQLMLNANLSDENQEKMIVAVADSAILAGPR